MQILFFIQYTGHGWGLAMTGEGPRESFNTDVAGTRTVIVPLGTMTAAEGHAIADAWNDGADINDRRLYPPTVEVVAGPPKVGA